MSGLSRRIKRAQAPLVLAADTPVDAGMVRTAWAANRPIECPDETILTEVCQVLGPVIISAALLHDNGCSPDVCRCTPSFLIREGTLENVQAGIAAEREWRRESLS